MGQLEPGWARRIDPCPPLPRQLTRLDPLGPGPRTRDFSLEALSDYSGTAATAVQQKKHGRRSNVIQRFVRTLHPVLHNRKVTGGVGFLLTLVGSFCSLVVMTH